MKIPPFKILRPSWRERKAGRNFGFACRFANFGAEWAGEHRIYASFRDVNFHQANLTLRVPYTS